METEEKTTGQVREISRPIWKSKFGIGMGESHSKTVLEVPISKTAGLRESMTHLPHSKGHRKSAPIVDDIPRFVPPLVSSRPFNKRIVPSREEMGVQPKFPTNLDFIPLETPVEENMRSLQEMSDSRLTDGNSSSCEVNKVPVSNAPSLTTSKDNRRHTSPDLTTRTAQPGLVSAVDPLSNHPPESSNTLAVASTNVPTIPAASSDYGSMQITNSGDCTTAVVDMDLDMDTDDSSFEGASPIKGNTLTTFCNLQ